MNYELTSISPKTYAGNLIFLLGGDVAERNLPLGKKEAELLRERRSEKKDCIVRFDRLPYYTYVVSFDSEKPAAECQELLRRSADTLRTMMIADKVSDAGLSGEGVIPEEMMAFIEGLTLSDYSFDRYKAKQPEHIGTLVVDSHFFTADEFEANCKLWNRIFWCREWVNLPVQDLKAEQFADELASIASDLGVSCTVFNKRQIESLRMGGLLAVNRGSVDEPRLVVLEYKPANAVNIKPLVLVGKGIMYDTGGLNIKPDDYMQEMKSDMAGAATMASALFAAADNELPVHVVAILPMTDNRPGFNAYAADDILTMYDGTTVEVVNTDAEGRLILADAIAYAVKNYDPELIVDAATLTGAAVRAISTFGIAVMQQNADNPYNLLNIVGNQVYERLVQFPFWKEYDELIKSEVADIKNCGIAQAGTITAGKFLAHFAKDVPYIHLDIAGVAYFSKKQHYYNVGASGYGIRLLYAFMQTYDLLNK